MPYTKQKIFYHFQLEDNFFPTKISIFFLFDISMKYNFYNQNLKMIQYFRSPNTNFFNCDSSSNKILESALQDFEALNYDYYFFCDEKIVWLDTLNKK